MKTRPILFSSDMIRAILDGRKTQTRRVVKLYDYDGGAVWEDRDGDLHDILDLCPYGKPGDRLYLKESTYRYGKWVKSGRTKMGRQKWIFKALTETDKVFYCRKGDATPNGPIRKNSYRKEGWYKRSALFMPKSSAGTWLEVTDVRVERVQEIAAQDAINEGLTVWRESATGSRYGIRHGDVWESDPRKTFQRLWDSINGKPRKDGVDISWAANPFVWCVTFKRLEER